jgi:peptide/nickel transport system substrate-binding protein
MNTAGQHGGSGSAISSGGDLPVLARPMARRNFLRNSGLLLVGGGLAPSLLAACSSSSSGGTSTTTGSKSQVLKSAILDTFTGFNPPTAGGLGDLDVTHHVFESLIQYSDPSLSTLAPWMIPSLPTKTGPTTYETTLLPGLTFHDGSPVTPSDVAFTWELILNPKTGSLYTAFMTLIEKVTTQGDKIVFNLSHDYGSFFQNIQMIQILPEKIYSAKGSAKFGNAPVGSGPFSFNASSTANTVNLDRYKAYKGTSKPKLDSLSFQTVVEDSTREVELIGGQLTVIEGVPASDMAPLSARPGIDTGAGFGGLMVALETDQNHPPFNNVLLRQALMYAIDRETIINTVFAGKYGRVTNSPLPPNNPYYVEPNPVYNYDIDKAKSLVAQAGYPNGLNFEFLVSTTPYLATMGPLIQESWRKAGLNATIRLVDIQAGYSLVGEKKKYDTFLVWGVNEAFGNDPDVYFRLSNYGPNRTAFYFINNPEYEKYDKLVDKGRLATTMSERKDFYGQAADIWSKEVSNFFAFINIASLNAWNSDVSGFTAPPNDVENFLNASIT